MLPQPYKITVNSRFKEFADTYSEDRKQLNKFLRKKIYYSCPLPTGLRGYDKDEFLMSINHACYDYGAPYISSRLEMDETNFSNLELSVVKDRVLATYTPILKTESRDGIQGYSKEEVKEMLEKVRLGDEYLINTLQKWKSFLDNPDSEVEKSFEISFAWDPASWPLEQYERNLLLKKHPDFETWKSQDVFLNFELGK